MKRLREAKLALDFVVLSAGQLLSKAVGIVAFAYLARTLGPEAYGSVEYVMGLCVFFTMIIDFGLGPIGVLELTRSTQGVSALAANIPIARLAIALLSMGTMVLLGSFSAKAGHDAHLIWLFAISLLAAPWKLEWLMQARDMMASAAAAQMIRMLVFSGAILLFVHSREDVVRVGWSEILAAFATSGYFLAVQHFRIAKINLHVSFSEAKRLLRAGASVGGGQMVSALNIYAPMFLVANIAGATETAWFGASHRLIVSLSTFSYVYHFNLYPVLARSFAAADGYLHEVVRASFRVLAWISIGGALLLTLLGRELLQLAFGEKFGVAASSFGILVWFLPCTLLSGHARWLLVAGERQHFLFLSQLAGALGTVVFGVPLVMLFDADGAAMAMLGGSVCVWGTAHYFALTRVVRIPSSSLLIRPIALASAIYLTAAVLRINPWLEALAGAFAFVGLAPIADRHIFQAFHQLVRAKSG